MNKKYVAPKITVIEMESSNIMAGSGNQGSPSRPDLPDTGTYGWTPDGDINHGFKIEEEGNDDYSDDNF